jgi:predicted kinase
MNRPSLILLVGIPGAGKSTYAKKYIPDYPKQAVHLSSDSIRAELYGDESIQGNPADVFSLMQKRVVEALNNGNDVIYDSTAMTRKDRAGIIGMCPKFAKIECHIIWASIEVCIERDSKRERTVGKEVINRMLKRFQAPWYDEGIDEIKVIFPDNFNSYPYTNLLFNAMQVDHNNPHHTLNILDHCLAANKYIVKKTGEYYSNIGFASLYHDIGKPYVKSFVDSKGNSCEYAHYYQHQCLSAWMSYGLPSTTPYIAWLISTHMDPFMNTKYYNNLPLFLKKDIDLLHEADLAAH